MVNSFLTDRFETLDGSTPHASDPGPDISSIARLSAFNVLREGDLFDGDGLSHQADAKKEATQWVRSNIVFKTNGAPRERCQLIARDLISQVRFNPGLVKRLAKAKHIQIDLIPKGHSMANYGFPRQIAPGISGLFWNHPQWDKARIAFREELLGEDPVLVVHEMAHAIHYLAFSKEERDLIYNFLRPTFGHRQAMDEVFAIYSEREFIEEFSIDEKAVSGIYGFTRSQWSENHVFTRFIRKLYFPHKPLAGPQLKLDRPVEPGLKLPKI